MRFIIVVDHIFIYTFFFYYAAIRAVLTYLCNETHVQLMYPQLFTD